MTIKQFNRQVRHELKIDLEEVYLKFARQNKKYIEERISAFFKDKKSVTETKDNIIESIYYCWCVYG